MAEDACRAEAWQKPGGYSPSQLKTKTLLLDTNGGHFNSLWFMVTGSLLEPASEDSYRYCSFRHHHLNLIFQPLRFDTFTSHWHLASHLGTVELCDAMNFLNFKSVQFNCLGLCQMKDDQLEQIVAIVLAVSPKWWSYFSQWFKAGCIKIFQSKMDWDIFQECCLNVY